VVWSDVTVLSRICKTVSRITYTVLVETLNPAQSINQSITYLQTPVETEIELSRLFSVFGVVLNECGYIIMFDWLWLQYCCRPAGWFILAECDKLTLSDSAFPRHVSAYLRIIPYVGENAYLFPGPSSQSTSAYSALGAVFGVDALYKLTFYLLAYLLLVLTTCVTQYSHWLCNVVLKRCCACTTLIWPYDDDDDVILAINLRESGYTLHFKRLDLIEMRTGRGEWKMTFFADVFYDWTNKLQLKPQNTKPLAGCKNCG